MGPPGQDTADSAAEAPAQRRRHVSGQVAVVALPSRARAHFRERAGPAPGLPQRPHEHRRPARLAVVEIGGPVVRLLALRADEHLLVGDDAALPRARPLTGIGLARPAAITRHGYSSARAFW